MLFSTRNRKYLQAILVVFLLLINIPVAKAQSSNDWLSIHVTKVEILKDKSGEYDGEAEFRLLMIAPHANGRNTYYSYPGDSVIPLSQGETAYIGESGLSIEIPSNANEVKLVLLGIDSDQTLPMFDYATTKFLSFASRKISEKIKDFFQLAQGSFTSWIVGEAVEVGASATYDYLKQNDILGETILTLPRSENWYADGGTWSILSANEAVRFTFEVRLAPSVSNYTSSTSSQTNSNNVSANINKVWTEHNVTQNNQTGMNVHLSFDVQGMKNKTGTVYLVFQDENGDLLETERGEQLDGIVGLEKYFTPSYADSLYEDMSFFFPYSNFELPYGEHDIGIVLAIFEHDMMSDDASLGYDTSITITYTNSSPSKADAQIESVWMDHGVEVDGVRGMMVHTKFYTSNMKDTKGYVVIYFYYENGSILKDLDGKYNLGNQVAIYSSFAPIYTEATYKDFKLFLPYSQFHVTAEGKTYLKFDVEIYNAETETFIGNSISQNVTFTN